MRLPWSAPERRWRDALVAAMMPADPGSALPGLSELDTREFWRECDARAPLLLQVGLRASVWALTLAPPVLIGAPRPFHRLTRAQQDRVLERAFASRSYLLRQLPLTIKLMACLAYFRDPGARAAVEQR